MKLQTAGLSFDADRHILSGNLEDNAFSVFHFAGDRLVAVDSINRPADHMIARRLWLQESTRQKKTLQQVQRA